MVGAAPRWPREGARHYCGGCLCDCTSPAAPVGDLGGLPLQVILSFPWDLMASFLSPSEGMPISLDELEQNTYCI